MSEKTRSTSLSDQALELCSIIDKYMCTYLDYVGALNFFDEEDKEMKALLESGISIMKLTEMFLITWAETSERTERKTDKILERLDQIQG